MPRAHRTRSAVARLLFGPGDVASHRTRVGSRDPRAGRPTVRRAADVALTALVILLLHGCPSRVPPAPAAPRVGQTPPDFALVDQSGKTVTLQGLRGTPVVLVFYRGFW